MNKVLFYHLEFPAGGTEKVTINIAKFLSNKNYEIHVMTSNKTQDKNFPYIKNIIEIPNQKSAFDESSAENFLIEYLQQKEIDIFVLPARLAPDLCSQIKKRTKCKIVFCLHSMPLWEVKSLLCSKKERSRRNLYKRIHWYTTTYIKGYWFNSYNRRFIAPYRETYNNVDVFVTLCTDYRNKLKKILHCSGKKIEIISNSEERPSQVNLNKNIEKENNRHIMPISNIYIMDHVEVPSVIVECGFLSNPEECENLKTESYQNKVAWGIYLGLQEYFSNK